LRIGVRCHGAQRDRAAAAAKRAPARAIAALKTLPFYSTIAALVELQLGLVPSCMALQDDRLGGSGAAGAQAGVKAVVERLLLPAFPGNS